MASWLLPRSHGLASPVKANAHSLLGCLRRLGARRRKTGTNGGCQAQSPLPHKPLPAVESRPPPPLARAALMYLPDRSG